jgi:hypothetical protein
MSPVRYVETSRHHVKSSLSETMVSVTGSGTIPENGHKRFQLDTLVTVDVQGNGSLTETVSGPELTENFTRTLPLNPGETITYENSLHRVDLVYIPPRPTCLEVTLTVEDLHRYGIKP